MASLYPPPALAAAAHRNIETAHHGPPDDLFMILCFAACQLHAASAMRTALRQWDRDPFIHAFRDSAARPVGRRGNPNYGLGVWDSVWGRRANIARRPAACWLGAPLPTLSVDARLL